MAVVTVRMIRQRDDGRRRPGLGEDHSFVSLCLVIGLHLAALVSVAHYTPETASLADPVRQAAELLPYPPAMPAETIQPPYAPPGDVVDPLASGAAEMAPEFGVESFLAQADVVILSVLGILLLMSVATWYLIINKGARTWRLRHRASKVVRHFWAAPSLAQAAAELESRRDIFAELLRQAQTGEEESEGIELDVGGSPMPGWEVIASYALTDARITKDTNASFVGRRKPNVPEHAASLWSRYEIQSSALRGLSFGAGVFYVGEREGDLDGSFELPSYIRTDALIGYRYQHWKLSLNVHNLFDRRYFTGGERTQIFPGEPLTVIGAIELSY